MTNEEFNATCEKAVKHYTYGIEYAQVSKLIPSDYYNGEIFKVWECKTLQNRKAILGLGGTNQLLFEVTYNGYKKETYVDVYDKKENFVIKEEEDD